MHVDCLTAHVTYSRNEGWSARSDAAGKMSGARRRTKARQRGLADRGSHIQGAVRAETARARAERVETQAGRRRKRRKGSSARVRW